MEGMHLCILQNGTDKSVPYIVKAKYACLHFLPAVKNSDRSFASPLQHKPVTLGFVLGLYGTWFYVGYAFMHTAKQKQSGDYVATLMRIEYYIIGNVSP